MSKPADALVLVTGGAGFIGSNLCAELVRRGNQVRVLDNLSRAGVRRNAAWLSSVCGDSIEIRQGDIRDPVTVCEAVRGVDVVYHLAGQVAVTTSVEDPRTDFEVNALGALNVLEAVRCSPHPPVFVYTSTNKVYGGMEELSIYERDGRYVYADFPRGIDESRSLDFHSPYGCSKGAADQYVRDYARLYGLRTVVFRMSCIYGPRQYGNEDQGWVAHFARAVLRDEPIRIYGDGKQVRDVLFVQDLVQAFCLAVEQIDTTRGEVFNIGGGPENALSLLELIAELRILLNREVAVTFHEWRPGDQRIYVSNSDKAARSFGWRPRTCASDGVRLLANWLCTDEATVPSADAA